MRNLYYPSDIDYWKAREAKPISFTLLNLNSCGELGLISYKATKEDVGQIFKKLERSNQLRAGKK